MLLSSEKPLAVDDYGGGGEVFAERHLCGLFVFRAGFDNGDDTLFGAKDDVVLHHDEGGGVFAADLLFPEALAFLGLVTGAGSFIGDHEVVAVGDDGAGDVGGVLASVPDDVGVGDITAAGGINGHHVEGRKAAGHVDVFPVVNRGGDVLIGGAVDDPVLFAGIGIVGGDAFAPGNDQLVSAFNSADDGCAVAAGFVGTRCFPNRLAGLFVETDEVGVAVVIAIDDDFVFPKNRAGAIAVAA